jgi:hypothetical protein
MKGRLFAGKGKTEESKMYKGGCIFVDSASGYVHIELQATLGSNEMLQAKEVFKLMCRDAGVVPTEYLLDNRNNFMSKAFSENLLKLDQKALFAGVGDHHHNGISKCHIQTITAIARFDDDPLSQPLARGCGSAAVADGCSTRCIHLELYAIREEWPLPH